MHTNGNIFDFNIFRRLGEFIRSIYFGDISLKQAMDKQEEMEYLVRNLHTYKPKKPEKINSKEKLVQKNFLKQET